MYLAYTDDSGDSGFINSPTTFFVLSCVIVHESAWNDTLQSLIGLRQELNRNYGIPVRAELKASHLIYNRGPMKALGLRPRDRIKIYEDLLDFQSSNLDIKVFAIAIAKERIISQATNDPRERGWQYLMQRLDTFCRKLEADTPPSHDKIMLLPDEGHGFLVRRTMRKMRRVQSITGHYGGKLDIRARFLVEDPIDKQSSESYFTQLADWNAYAAHHYKDVLPYPRRFPPDAWERLGNLFLQDVNSVAGGPPGIVVWPPN